MAQTLVFKKQLKKTDLKHRLSVPTRSVKNLPEFETGQNHVSFRVLDEKNRVWLEFYYYKRKKGSYLKPVFSKGWTDFVRLNGLTVKDAVALNKVAASGDGVRYEISVIRPRLTLFGADITPRLRLLGVDITP